MISYHHCTAFCDHGMISCFGWAWQMCIPLVPSMGTWGVQQRVCVCVCVEVTSVIPQSAVIAFAPVCWSKGLQKAACWGILLAINLNGNIYSIQNIEAENAGDKWSATLFDIWENEIALTLSAERQSTIRIWMWKGNSWNGCLVRTGTQLSFYRKKIIGKTSISVYSWCAMLQHFTREQFLQAIGAYLYRT